MKHNFPKGVNIVCKLKHNAQQAKEVFHLAIDGDCIIAEITLKEPVDNEYPYFIWDTEMITQTSDLKENSDCITVTFEGFKEFLKGKGKFKPSFKEEIKIPNSNYTAVVTKKGIKVGCTFISHEICEKIYKSSQKALKS